MGITVSPPYDRRVGDVLNEVAGLYKASLRWYWRLLAGIISLATIIDATFQVLSYLHR